MDKHKQCVDRAFICVFKSGPMQSGWFKVAIHPSYVIHVWQWSLTYTVADSGSVKGSAVKTK